MHIAIMHTAWGSDFFFVNFSSCTVEFCIWVCHHMSWVSFNLNRSTISIWIWQNSAYIVFCMMMTFLTIINWKFFFRFIVYLCSLRLIPWIIMFHCATYKYKWSILHTTKGFKRKKKMWLPLHPKTLGPVGAAPDIKVSPKISSSPNGPDFRIYSYRIQ